MPVNRPKIVNLPITENDWLQEIERLSAKQVDGFSTAELAKSAARTVEWARRMIRRGIDAGRLEYAGSRTCTRIDNKPGVAAVYRLVRS